MGNGSYSFDENIVSLVMKVTSSIEGYFNKWGILDKICENDEKVGMMALMAYDIVSFGLDTINTDEAINENGRNFIRKCFGERYTDARIDIISKQIRKEGYEKKCLWMPLIISVDSFMGAKGDVAQLYMMGVSYFTVGLLQTSDIHAAELIKY